MFLFILFYLMKIHKILYKYTKLAQSVGYIGMSITYLFPKLSALLSLYDNI